MNWDHKDEWRKRGRNFMVTITRHYDEPIIREEGPHRWAVYAYIYPNHPHFAAIKEGGGMWQDATNMPGIHYCCSYLQKHEKDGKVTSWQIGADYHHIHDAEFTHMATLEDAHEVEQDAEELFRWLNEHDQPRPTQEPKKEE